MITSLIKRIYFIVLALPIGLLVFWAGGWVFTLSLVGVFSLAAFEYCRIFELGGYQPSRWAVIGGTAALVLTRYIPQYIHVEVILTAVVFCAMGFHLIRYEHGRDPAAGDFCVTVAGVLYFGWLGGYFVALRMIPNGVGWFTLMMVTVWMVDTGGYCIGRPFGKHFMTPHLSPRKTWEGYFGGILGGMIGALVSIWIWRRLDPLGSMPVQYWHGVLAGLVLGLLTPMGDLGESMVKRQFFVKDSSHLIPGHGGVWDRIDSWLWGIPISYYLVMLIFLR